MLIRSRCTKCNDRVTKWDREIDNLRWTTRQDDLVGGPVQEPNHVDCAERAQ